MSPRYQSDSPLVCHCLRVTQAELLDAAQRCPLKSIRDAMRETGAGSGCTSCHRQIEALIRRER